MAENHPDGIQSTPGAGTSHGHGHDAAHPPASPFTPTEIEHFQQEDRYAGGTVVVLMATIFSIGVVLYSIVLASVL
jgi:hypothetical protein